MRSLSSLWILFAALFATAPFIQSQNLSSPGKAGKTRVLLHDGWKLRQAGTTNWYPATIPGCVHTDLLANKLIEDPFYRDNEQRLQWIGKTDWDYQTSFSLGPEVLTRQHVELLFEGLDTYAEVYLNESLLLNANNMFREWRVDCKSQLRTGANQLRIHFRSPINEVLAVMAKLNYLIRRE